jgi:hypothetical protein
LQGQASEAGSIARISAPDVEALIASAIRANGEADQQASDREIIENHLGRAIGVCEMPLRMGRVAAKGTDIVGP